MANSSALERSVMKPCFQEMKQYMVLGKQVSGMALCANGIPASVLWFAILFLSAFNEQKVTVQIVLFLRAENWNTSTINKKYNRLNYWPNLLPCPLENLQRVGFFQPWARGLLCNHAEGLFFGGGAWVLCQYLFCLMPSLALSLHATPPQSRRAATS